jgi:kynurenine formamidase
MVSRQSGASPQSDVSVLLGRAVRVIDISLELDASKFRMRTYAGFKKDMQFETEVLKDYDDGGLKQLVRGVHMRLHAGSHIDAPSHMIKGGRELHDLDLNTFIGPAIVTDLRHRGGGDAITADDLEKSAGSLLQAGDRLLLRTDINKDYDGSREWMARAPYVSDDAVLWCAKRAVSIVGFDFYHANEPGPMDPENCTTRKLLQRGIITMPYLTNLWSITKPRVTLVSLPLKMRNVEASPIRAVVLEE